MATLMELELVPAILAELELVVNTAKLVLTELVLAVLLELALALANTEERDGDSVSNAELGMVLVGR